MFVSMQRCSDTYVTHFFLRGFLTTCSSDSTSKMIAIWAIRQFQVQYDFTAGSHQSALSQSAIKL